jgi:hypothetical protein
MSTSEEVSLKLLLLDGSNYASWSASVLTIFNDMGPHFERIVDVSISPPSDDLVILSKEEVKCLQYNAQTTNVLFSTLSEGVLDAVIFEDGEPLDDAHIIWTSSKKDMTSPNVTRICSHWRNHLRSAQLHQQMSLK